VITLPRAFLAAVLIVIGMNVTRHYFGSDTAHSVGLFILGFCIGGLIFDRPRS